MPYGYLYRIDVPADFPDTHLSVQLFDPDTYNRADLPPTPNTPIATATFCAGVLQRYEEQLLLMQRLLYMVMPGNSPTAHQ